MSQQINTVFIATYVDTSQPDHRRPPSEPIVAPDPQTVLAMMVDRIIGKFEEENGASIGEIEFHTGASVERMYEGGNYGCCIIDLSSAENDSFVFRVKFTLKGERRVYDHYEVTLTRVPIVDSPRPSQPVRFVAVTMTPGSWVSYCFDLDTDTSESRQRQIERELTTVSGWGPEEARAAAESVAGGQWWSKTVDRTTFCLTW